MKFVKRIGLFFAIPMCILCVGILCGIFVSNYFYPGNSGGNQTVRESQPFGNTETPPPVSLGAEEEVVSVEAQDRLLLNSETAYVLEETDVTEGTVTENIMKLPEKYIGMSREEFLESLEVYELSPPLKELEKGFVGLEVLSFSTDKVVIQMNYALQSMSKDYYILVEDHSLVVYLGDRKTLFMYTEIKLEDLPHNVRQQVIDGLYMESEERLYDFLESYTS